MHIFEYDKLWGPSQRVVTLLRHPVHVLLCISLVHMPQKKDARNIVGIWVVHCCVLSLFLLDFEASLGNAALFLVDLEVAGKR